MTIYRKLIALCLFSFATVYAHAEANLTRQQIPELKMSLSIPEAFTRMSESARKAAFPDDGGPQVVFSNKDQDAFIIITSGYTDLKADDLDLFKTLMLFSMKKFKPQADAAVVDGHKSWIVSFTTPAEGEKSATSNLLLLTSQNEKAVQVVANMKTSSEAQYKEPLKAALLTLAFDR